MQTLVPLQMKQEKVGYLSAKGKTIYIFRGEDAILFLTMSPNAIGKLNWPAVFSKNILVQFIVGPWVYICKYYIWYIVYVYLTDMH